MPPHVGNVGDSMTTVNVENPDEMVTKKADGQGRVYLGRAYADREVEVVVTLKDSDDVNPADSPAEGGES